jgi:glycosyltransferase involved in cell wall biosynthesis
MIVLLVTVLVVSFNQSKYIRENLDSIRDQSYSNIELIVADDAQPIRLWL